MIDCVATDGPPSHPPSLKADLERLQRAAAERVWRQFVRELPGTTEAMERATRVVETDWFSLNEDDQDLMLLAKSLLDEVAASGPRTHPNLGERLISRFSGSADEESRRLFQFGVAIGRFTTAIRRVLAEESRLRNALETSMSSDPEVKAEIERGIAEDQAGKGATYTLQEFETRFNLS